MTAIRDTTPGAGVTIAGVQRVFDQPPTSEPTVYGLDKRVSLLEHMIKVQSKQLEAINSNLSKIVWLIVVAVAGALLSLVVRGGASIVI